MPTQTGQSAFASIAEIVAIPEDNPDAQWSDVSIDALRSHLVDMDQLALSALVATTQIDEQTIQFHITSEGNTLRAIQFMLPTHAQMVRESSNWEIVAVRESDGVQLTIRTGSSEAFIKFEALGFFGFMTIGAHHLQIAKGDGH